MSSELLEWDFFLVHASADKPRAEALYDALGTEYRVFLDSKVLRAGDSWGEAITDALHSTRIFVILVSTRSEGAYYANEELSTAIALIREDRRRRVVPIFLDGIPNKIPYGLRSKHRLDAQKRSMAELAADLRNLANNPPAVPISDGASRRRLSLAMRAGIALAVVLCSLLLLFAFWGRPDFFRDEPNIAKGLTSTTTTLEPTAPQPVSRPGLEQTTDGGPSAPAPALAPTPAVRNKKVHQGPPLKGRDLPDPDAHSIVSY